MPCKSGTRQDIEDSKVAARERREQQKRDAVDPFQIYWHELVDRVHGPSGGLPRLSDVERQYWGVGCLVGEVHNGGFEQYFYNSSGETYPDTIEGLRAMGAEASLLLLQEAKRIIFGRAEVPGETGARRQILAEAGTDALQVQLDELDKLFWADPDELAVRSEAFAVTHGLMRHIPAPSHL